MRINITLNTDAVMQRMKDQAKQMPFALSVAINKTIAETRPFVQRLMDLQYEGGPVPFTKRALFYTKSTKRDLRAALLVHRDAEYIIVTAQGGIRTKTDPGKKAMISPVRDGKYRVPYKTTAQGNVPYKKAPNLLKNKDKYFSGNPRGKAGEKYAGIWMRVGKGGKKALKMVLKYDVDTPRRQSTTIMEDTKEYALQRFHYHIEAAIKQAMASSR